MEIRCYQKILRCQRENSCQGPAGNLTTRSPDHRKETQTTEVWTCLPFISLAKTILQGTVKGEEDKADRGRGVKTTSGKRTGLEFTESRRRMENKEKWRNPVVESSVVPPRPSRLRAWLGEELCAFTYLRLILVSWCFEPSQPQRITSGLLHLNV